VSSDGLDALPPAQAAVVRGALPGAEVVHDHSWGLVPTVVLELRTPDGAAYVVKAGGEADHHIAREVRAHRHWVGVLAGRGRAPTLVHGDADAKVVVTTHLPGRLVEGTPAEWEPQTYRQAGELLAAFHGQSETCDDGGFERDQRDDTLHWLGRSHRIDPASAALLREEVEAWPAPPSRLAPTHGDWQPRNWLVHDGTVSVIDFGRADLRPRHTDLGRLAVQQWRGRPDLEAAFWEGYGGDPRTSAAWLRLRIREAVGTAAYAVRTGDVAFEEQGLRMVADVVRDLRDGAGQP